MRAGTCEQLRQCPFRGLRAAINLFGGHRVIGIDDRDDSSFQRQLLAVTIEPGPTPVVPGGRILDDGQHILGGTTAQEDLFASGAALVEQRAIIAREWIRLQQDPIGDPDLADVVEQSSHFQFVALLFLQH